MTAPVTKAVPSHIIFGLKRCGGKEYSNANLTGCHFNTKKGYGHELRPVLTHLLFRRTFMIENKVAETLPEGPEILSVR